jgi:hypothetical protein
VVPNQPFKRGAEFLQSPARAAAIADRLVVVAVPRFSGKPYRQPRDVLDALLDNE